MAAKRRRPATPDSGTGPPELTEKLAARICELVKAGLTEEEAAAGAGAQPLYVLGWLEQGARVKKGPLRVLHNRVQLAKAARTAALLEKTSDIGTLQALEAARQHLDDKRRAEREAPPIRGRATKCTPSLVRELARCIRAGAPRHVAAMAVGIDSRTLKEWKIIGEADLERDQAETPHAFLVLAWRHAEAEGHVDKWLTVQRGLETGRQEHVAAGKLGLQALELRHGKRYRPGKDAPMVPSEGGEGDGEELVVKVVVESATQALEAAPSTQGDAAAHRNEGQ